MEEIKFDIKLDKTKHGLKKVHFFGFVKARVYGEGERERKRREEEEGRKEEEEKKKSKVWNSMKLYGIHVRNCLELVWFLLSWSLLEYFL